MLNAPPKYGCCFRGIIKGLDPISHTGSIALDCAANIKIALRYLVDRD